MSVSFLSDTSNKRISFIMPGKLTLLVITKNAHIINQTYVITEIILTHLFFSNKQIKRKSKASYHPLQIINLKKLKKVVPK